MTAMNGHTFFFIKRLNTTLEEGALELNLIIFFFLNKRLCGENSLSFSNTLLVNSIFGNILYMFSLKHINNLKPHYAIGFSLFGSVMFNFGSILFWSISKAYLPDDQFLLFNYGLLTGLLMLHGARTYFDSIENSHLYRK